MALTEIWREHGEMKDARRGLFYNVGYEAPVATASADAAAALVMGTAYSAATTGTGTGVYSSPDTTITATASIFTTAMIGASITIATVGTYVIHTVVSATQVKVTGSHEFTSLAISVVAGGVFASRLVRYRIQQLYKPGKSLVVAYYEPPHIHRVLEENPGVGILETSSFYVSETLKWDLSATPLQMQGDNYDADNDVPVRWEIIKGSEVVKRAYAALRLSVALTLTGSQPLTFAALGDSVNAAACGGAAARTLWMTDVHCKQVYFNQRLYFCQFDMAYNAAEWNLWTVAEKKKAVVREVPVLNAAGVDKGHVHRIVTWEPYATRVTAARKTKLEADWSALAGYLT